MPKSPRGGEGGGGDQFVCMPEGSKVVLPKKDKFTEFYDCFSLRKRLTGITHVHTWHISLTENATLPVPPCYVLKSEISIG